MKATQDGTCQLCGARQRLPGGVLAQHGYTVDYGYFNGVCLGTGHPAFERSREVLGEHIARIADYLERLEARLAALAGPAPDQRGVHVYRVFGERHGRSVTGTFSHGHDDQGREALLITSDTGEVRVVAVRHEGVRLPTPQEAADRARREQRDGVRQVLELTRLDLRHQQQRFDGWQPREPLPLTSREVERERRAAVPRPPTKKQQATERFRATFREKYGREPVWGSWQTTNNNPALFAFGHLISSLGKYPDGSFAGYAPETLTRPLTRAASQVMNLAGMDGFLAWAGELLRAPVCWHERRQEFQTAAGEEARYVADFTGSLGAAQAVLSGPVPEVASFIPTAGPVGCGQPD